VKVGIGASLAGMTVCGHAASQQTQRSAWTFVAPDPLKISDWQHRWQTSILNEAHARYCDTQMGEEIGWLMAPVLEGFYFGLPVTQDTLWV
jgi:hypothetical protein